MEIKKKYITVNDENTLRQMYDHIQEHDILAVDTESTSLNVRSGKIIGWSVSGKEGKGFYIPTLIWNADKQELQEVKLLNKPAEETSKVLINELKGKKLVFHNASFDCRLIKNYYKINLIPDIWVDTALLVHTVQEEGAGMGVFGLKPLAISVQEEIGLNVEEEANKEQVLLKKSIKANGGATTKTNFEIYKADLDILAEYGAADTDLTLRLCTHFLKKLKDENLEKFFFEEEVMPIYREVTIPMEERGIHIDLELVEKTYEEILKDLEINKKVVLDSLMGTSEAKKWVLDTAVSNYPTNHKGNFAQELVSRYSLPLPRSEKTGKYSLTAKNIEALEESSIKDFLLTGDEALLEEVERYRISMKLWKDDNEGEYLNIQSKKHLGEIVFDYMGIKPLSKTNKGTPQFNSDMIEELSKKYDWAENLRVYNKLLKIKSTYIERFLDNHENGKYYFYFKQHGTVSGRYGSDAQQLPKPKEEGEDAEIIVKYTNIVRAFLVAGKGRKFIDSDYESLEPHCIDPEGFVTVNGKIKRIDNIKEGDVIQTVNGLDKVIKKWYSNKSAFRIRHRKGELVASKDHKFYIIGKGWTKVDDLKKGDILETSLHNRLDNVSKTGKLPLYPGKIQELKSPIGNFTVTDEIGYVTGMLLGDGMITDGGIGLVGLHKDGLTTYFRDFINRFGYNTIEINESETVHQVRVVSRELHSIVKNSLNIIGENNKKLLRVPEWVMNSKASVKTSFLAGLIDTDGTVSKRGNEASISSKDSRFLTDIIVLGSSLGLDLRLSQRSTTLSKDGKRELEWGSVRFTKETLITLQQEYHLLDYIKVDKKKVLAESTGKGFRESNADIFEIIPIENKRLVDITVEKSQEFIYDRVRTHNCFASVTEDENLREIFNKGWDFYSTVAIKTEKLEGFSPDKSADNYLKKLDPVKRGKAKAYSLGIAYGMEDFALGLTLDIPQKEAKKLVDGYLNGFPDLKRWREESRRTVKETGQIVNYVGRIRHLPKVKLIYDKFGDDILDWRFRKQLSDRYGTATVLQIYRDYKNGLNNCLNFQLQSLSASVVNRAALKINRKAKELGLDAVVVAQIHDQLVIDVDEKEAEMFAPIVQDIMENNLKLPGVTLKAPPEIANNLKEGH